VTARTLALSVAAAVVVGLAVYLFVEVRADPAAPQVAPAERPAVPDRGTSAPAVEAVAPGAMRPRGAGAPPSVQLKNVRPADERPPALEATAPPAIDEHANPRLDMVMDEANKAYDEGDFDKARAVAQRVLGRTPTNVRMLRIMVSSSCIEGDQPTAQQYYNMLPAADRLQMRTRCAEKSGITFTEPAPQPPDR
jgi:hypothetical protein